MRGKVTREEKQERRREIDIFINSMKSLQFFDDLITMEF